HNASDKESVGSGSLGNKPGGVH
ncbi:unnamed protein product, partial [Allacma fusca]